MLQNIDFRAQFLLSYLAAMKLSSFNHNITNSTEVPNNTSALWQNTSEVFFQGYHTVAPNYPQEFLTYVQRLQTPSLLVDVSFIRIVKKEQTSRFPYIDSG